MCLNLFMDDDIEIISQQFKMFEDSFDDLIKQHHLKDSEYQQPYGQPPPAISTDMGDYDLTFKKQQKQKIINNDDAKYLSKNIFAQKTNKSDLKLLKNIIDTQFPNILQVKSDTNTLFELKQQQNLDIKTQLKIDVIICHKQLVNLRKKRNSALMNYRILKGQLHDDNNKKQLSKEDEYRAYLLQSLTVQYNKKIFIASLKYNNWVVKLQRINEHKQQQLYDDQEMQNQFLEYGTQQQQLSEQQQIQYQELNIKQSAYYNQNRLHIFMQIIETIIDKQKFQSFKKIYHHKSDNLVEQANNQMPADISNDDQLIKQNRIRTINAFILDEAAKIRPKPKTNKDLLKNYFTRWKIYFLMNMIRLIKNDPNISDSQVYSDYHNLQLSAQQEGIQDDQNSQFATDFLSQQNTQNPLKQQKHNLKLFLQINRKQQFINKLSDMHTNQQLKQMVKGIYRCNLLKRSLKGLKINAKIEQYYQQLQNYSEQIANNQNQDATVSKIFQRTNLITKVFSALSTYRKINKLVNLLSITQHRLNFRAIMLIAYQTTKNSEKIQRFLKKRKRMLLFKCFNYVKNISPNRSQNILKVTNFRQNREMQIKDYYFSLIKLLYKLRLKNSNKITHIIRNNSAKKFFYNLRSVYNNQCQLVEKTNQLEIVSKLTKKKKYMKKIILFHIQKLESKKRQIKMQKIRTVRFWKNIQNGLKRWKMYNLQKKCHLAIEIRLIRLKERQQRQKIFKIWYQRALQKNQRNRKANSNNHKIWLQKYYEKLCAIQK